MAARAAPAPTRRVRHPGQGRRRKGGQLDAGHQPPRGATATLDLGPRGWRARRGGGRRAGGRRRVRRVAAGGAWQQPAGEPRRAGEVPAHRAAGRRRRPGRPAGAVPQGRERRRGAPAGRPERRRPGHRAARRGWAHPPAGHLPVQGRRAGRPGALRAAGRRAAPARARRRPVRLLRGLGPPPELFTYDEAAPAGARLLSRARLRFSPSSRAAWQWDAGAGSFVRYQDGTLQREEGGARITTENVVILHVAIGSTSNVDAAGNVTPDVKVVGEGAAWVLRDGKLVTGRWRRPAASEPVQLLGSDGAAIALHPGRTWMELLPERAPPAFG